MRDWDIDAALSQLKSERAYDGFDLDSTDQNAVNETTKRILREAAPLAAMALVHIAQNSMSEAMRFKAAKEILDRNLGKIGETPKVAEEDPYAALLRDCVTAINTTNDQGNGEG